ncbi:MAG: hypothetical protein K2X76_03020 [Sphingomonas sp.]|nr:hypothetical protein [Sphingomonas sp.]
MDSLAPIAIAKALDGLALRAAATAENIANANSPNYRAVVVRFEEQLRAAAARGADAVRSVTPETTHAPLPALGGEMRLDLEMATAAQTAMRYAALIDILGRQIQIDRAVIAGGR